MNVTGFIKYRDATYPVFKQVAGYFRSDTCVYSLMKTIKRNVRCTNVSEVVSEILPIYHSIDKMYFCAHNARFARNKRQVTLFWNSPYIVDKEKGS